MENPDSWNLLTACLAACRLDDLAETWAFLVEQRVVEDAPNARERFAAAVAAVKAEGPITGPSEPLRIAMRMVGDRGPAASTADPWGKLAGPRLEQFRTTRARSPKDTRKA